MKIRRAFPEDCEALMKLYLAHLAKKPPENPGEPAEWRSLLAELAADPDYHLLVAELDGRAVSSVTVVLVKNLTNGLRPYAVIENVVTHADFRGRGFASALMARAEEIARERGCYKIMLLTGSKKESTLRFYRGCGYDSGEKTAFIKRL